MIVSALIFFDVRIHHKILNAISKLIKINRKTFDNEKTLPVKKSSIYQFKYGILILFFAVQLFFPWRYLLYSDELFWTEEGYRFSWRVMLIEKSGYAQFKIVNKETDKWFYVNNADFLTPIQEKQMAFQPDFILAYAHYLKAHFENDGHQNIAIYVECYVALNGRLSQPYIDPKVDLVREKDSFKHKTWILPFKDEIKGI